MTGALVTGDSIAGIGISLYPPDNEIHTDQELRKFLKPLQLNQALVIVNKISKLLSQSGALQTALNIPISQWLIAVAAQKLIENSDDLQSQEPNMRDIVYALHLYQCIPKTDGEADGSETGVLRYGSSIFDLQHPALVADFSRTLLIYDVLWNSGRVIEVPDIAAAFQTAFNLDLIQILYFGLFHFNQNDGVLIVADNAIEPGSFVERANLNPTAQRKFLDRFSATYSDFRRRSEKEKAKAPNLYQMQFAFNPLFVKPMIKPDRWLPQVGREHWLLPVPVLLFQKVTKGLYHDLAETFRGKGNKNPFRAAFGHVFESYVGHILAKSLDSSQPLPEREYNQKHGVKKTPDWILLYNTTGVCFEAKVCATYLESKVFADSEGMARDLSKTASKGILQIHQFEEDRTSFPELTDLAEITDFERVIVTYDILYFANSLLKKRAMTEAHRLDPKLPKDYHCHFMSIDELELIVAIPGVNLFEFLKQKRLVDDSMDFTNYLRKQSQLFANPYLKQVYDEFIESTVGLREVDLGRREV